METTTTDKAPSAAPSANGGLILARRQIAAARARDAQPSDGGGTGRTDSND